MLEMSAEGKNSWKPRLDLYWLIGGSLKSSFLED